ncbi:unnamed protein product [Moneuplotes crassus]|uniref:Uncharacterized protein n=1 Tax=Euplotes crassus TaxID=5936 RepID=A0AAD1Y8I7_EUPCR|nr:unnamed protein product [Moneuplotes crassus]
MAFSVGSKVEKEDEEVALAWDEVIWEKKKQEMARIEPKKIFMASETENVARPYANENGPGGSSVEDHGSSIWEYIPSFPDAPPQE